MLFFANFNFSYYWQVQLDVKSRNLFNFWHNYIKVKQLPNVWSGIHILMNVSKGHLFVKINWHRKFPTYSSLLLWFQEKKRATALPTTHKTHMHKTQSKMFSHSTMLIIYLLLFSGFDWSSRKQFYWKSISFKVAFYIFGIILTSLVPVFKCLLVLFWKKNVEVLCQ